MYSKLFEELITLQRHNIKNLKKLFQEKELLQSHDLYIPTISLPSAATAEK
jgi:hypothetical protein